MLRRKETSVTSMKSADTLFSQLRAFTDAQTGHVSGTAVKFLRGIARDYYGKQISSDQATAMMARQFGIRERAALRELEDILS